MQDERKTISPLLYYLLVSSLTNLIFFTVGVIALVASFPRIKIHEIAIVIIVVFFLGKGVIVGFVSWFAHRRSQLNKDFTVKFVGRYLGRFFGMIIGGILGAKIASLIGSEDLIGIFIGAIIFYFVGRWSGSRVSLGISNQLDRRFSVADTQDLSNIKTRSLKRYFYILYVAIVNLLFVVTAFLMNYYDIRSSHLFEWLSVGRIVAIALSLFYISLPWLIKKRWLTKVQPSTSSPEIDMPWIGLAFSIVPLVCGFILFIGMGASIIELCCFAITSFIAAIIWSISSTKGQNTG